MNARYLGPGLCRRGRWHRHRDDRQHSQAPTKRSQARTRRRGSRRRRGATPTCRACGATKRPSRSSDRRSFEGRESLTDEEVAQRQTDRGRAGGAAARGRRRRRRGPAIRRRVTDPRERYNSFWQDHGRPRQVLKQTSLIVDPKDGQIPYTPDARKAEARASAATASDRTSRTWIPTPANAA